MFFRWFNHISAAAEAYKLRTKSNHDITPIEDPSSVTIANSTKESTDNEFITSGTPVNTSATATADNIQNQYLDGQHQKDVTRHSVNADGETNEG